jgi:hypothetical protein
MILQAQCERKLVSRQRAAKVFICLNHGTECVSRVGECVIKRIALSYQLREER